LRFDGAAKGAIEKVEIEITAMITAGVIPAGQRWLMAEPVLIGAAGRLWLTVGAMAPDAPRIATEAWRFEEVEAQWDRLVLRTLVGDHLIHEDTLAALGSARDLILQATGSKRLEAGVAIFCGAPSAVNGPGAGRPDRLELADAVLGRTIAYSFS
jgi:hypothetical protein